MVRVGWRPPPGRRIVGPYVWERANGWVADVATEDLEEILTHPGFFVAERDDLAAVDGIGERREEELLLIGIATFEQLADAEPDVVAARLGVGEESVRAWQDAARAFLDGCAAEAHSDEEV